MVDMETLLTALIQQVLKDAYTKLQLMAHFHK